MLIGLRATSSHVGHRAQSNLSVCANQLLFDYLNITLASNNFEKQLQLYVQFLRFNKTIFSLLLQKLLRFRFASQAIDFANVNMPYFF